MIKNTSSDDCKKENFNFKKYIVFIILFLSLAVTSFGAFKYFQMKKNNNNLKMSLGSYEVDGFEKEEMLSENKKEFKDMLDIVYATDDRYVLLTYISIFSLLEHSNPEDDYKITVLYAPSVSEENIKKFMNLEEKYENCIINLVNISKIINDLDNRPWYTPCYYRLNISEVLPETKKCLYLDGDTLIFKNIREIFDFDIGDNYVAGVRDQSINVYEGSNYHKSNLGIDNLDSYICSGVLFMNLEKIRNDKIDQKFFEIASANGGKETFVYRDQDVINIACFGKIRSLPCKYGFLNPIDYNEAYEDSIYAKHTQTKKDWDEGRSDPFLVHYTVKPWSVLNKFEEFWWKTAKRTIYFNEIYQTLGKDLNEESKSKINKL